MTKKSEDRILEEELGIDLPEGDDEVECESLEEKDLTGGNNTRDPSRSIFDPSGSSKSSFVGTTRVEKGVERNRYIGTLVQSSRTELKYKHNIRNQLKIGDRSVKLNSLKRVEEGDKVRIQDDRGYRVTKFIESLDETNDVITFVSSVEKITDKNDNESDHISKNADIAFVRRRIPWLDVDENIRSSSLLKVIQRSVQTFVGENGTTEKNNGFEIESVQTNSNFESQSDNFVISKGSGESKNLEEAGRYYLKGIPALVHRDVLYEPKTSNQFSDSKIIMPETTDVINNPDFRDEGFIIDKNASFPVSDAGESYLAGRKVLLGFPNPVEYEIKSNTKNKLVVNTKNRPDVEEVTGGKTFYRLRLQKPENNNRNDMVYLNLFFKEITQNDDSDIYAMNQGRRKTHSQNRLQIKQRVEVRQGDEPEIDYNGTDDQGRYHLIVELAELDRSPDGIITKKEIKDLRNVFRSLDKLGLQNLLFNPSFEFTNTNTGPGQTLFIDWNIRDNGFDTNVVVNEDNNIDHHQTRSSEVQVNEQFNGAVEFYQEFQGTDLVNSVFRDQTLTFSMDAMPLDDTKLEIKPFIREVSSSNGNSLSEGMNHSGTSSFQRMTVTHTVRDVKIDKIELGFKIVGDGSSELNAVFDRGALVYGNFPSGVPYFNNKTLEDLSTLRDEIRDARRSEARDMNFNDLDSRIDGYENEIVTARSSDVKGTFNSLDQRNETTEDVLTDEHNLFQERNHPNFGFYRSNDVKFLKTFTTGKVNSGGSDQEFSGRINYDMNPRMSAGNINYRSGSNPNHFYLVEDNLRGDGWADGEDDCWYLSTWGVTLTVFAYLDTKVKASSQDDKDELKVDLDITDDKGFSWVDVNFEEKVEASGNIFEKGGTILEQEFGSFGGELLEAAVLGIGGALIVDDADVSGAKFAWPIKNDPGGKFGHIECIGGSHPYDDNLFFDDNFPLDATIDYYFNFYNETGDAWYIANISMIRMSPLNLLVK